MTLDRIPVPVIVVNGVISERSAKGYKDSPFFSARSLIRFHFLRHDETDAPLAPQCSA